MRKTIKEIEVNVAYRWFIGIDLRDPVPHFTTFGKNYTRRFKDTDIFEQIFANILDQCFKHHLVDTSIIFVDATHIKACANSKKRRKKIIQFIQKNAPATAFIAGVLSTLSSIWRLSFTESLFNFSNCATLRCTITPTLFLFLLSLANYSVNLLVS